MHVVAHTVSVGCVVLVYNSFRVFSSFAIFSLRKREIVALL